MHDDIEDEVLERSARSKRAQAAAEKSNSQKPMSYKDKHLERLGQQVAKTAKVMSSADSYQRQIPLDEKFATLKDNFDTLSKDFRKARVAYLKELNHLRSCMRRVEERYGSLADVGIDVNVVFYDQMYYEEDHIRLFAEAIVIQNIAKDGDDQKAGMAARVVDKLQERIRVLENEVSVQEGEITKLLMLLKKKLKTEGASAIAEIRQEIIDTEEKAQEREHAAKEHKRELRQLQNPDSARKSVMKMKDAFQKAKLGAKVLWQKGDMKPDFNSIAEEPQPEKKSAGFLPAAAAHRAKQAFLRKQPPPSPHGVNNVDLVVDGHNRGYGHQSTAERLFHNTHAHSNICKQCHTRRWQIQVLEAEVTRLRSQLKGQEHERAQVALELEKHSVHLLQNILKCLHKSIDEALPQNKPDVVATLLDSINETSLEDLQKIVRMYVGDNAPVPTSKADCVNAIVKIQTQMASDFEKLSSKNLHAFLKGLRKLSENQELLLGQKSQKEVIGMAVTGVALASIADLQTAIKSIVGDHVPLPTRKVECVSMLLNAVEGAELERRSEHSPNGPKGISKVFAQAGNAFAGKSFGGKSSGAMSTEFQSVQSINLSDDDPLLSRWSEDLTPTGPSEEQISRTALNPSPPASGALFNACMMETPAAGRQQPPATSYQPAVSSQPPSDQNRNNKSSRDPRLNKTR